MHLQISCFKWSSYYIHTSCSSWQTILYSYSNKKKNIMFVSVNTHSQTLEHICICRYIHIFKNFILSRISDDFIRKILIILYGIVIKKIFFLFYFYFTFHFFVHFFLYIHLLLLSVLLLYIIHAAERKYASLATFYNHHTFWEKWQIWLEEKQKKNVIFMQKNKKNYSFF